MVGGLIMACMNFCNQIENEVRNYLDTQGIEPTDDNIRREAKRRWNNIPVNEKCELVRISHIIHTNIKQQKARMKMSMKMSMIVMKRRQ